MLLSVQFRHSKIFSRKAGAYPSAATQVTPLQVLAPSLGHKRESLLVSGYIEIVGGILRILAEPLICLITLSYMHSTIESLVSNAPNCGTMFMIIIDDTS